MFDTRIFEKARNSGTPDESKTLKGFQRRSGVTRQALQTLRREYLQKLKEFGETYSAKAFEERRKPLDEEYAAYTKIARKLCTDDLNAVIEAKRKQFEACSGAPSEEQLRLLNVLSMRSELTASEVSFVAAKLNDNIPGLRLLREIAQKHGIAFPDVGNSEAFDRRLSRAEEYAQRMIESIEKPDDELGYRERCFWLYPDTTTEADALFGDLDGSIFSAAQIAESRKHAETESQEKAADSGKNKPNTKKPNAVRVYLRGDENLAGISMQFNISSAAIRAANPEFDFSNFSPGKSIVVPAGRLKITNEPGSVIPDQCFPTYYTPPEPAPKAGESVDICE